MEGEGGGRRKKEREECGTVTNNEDFVAATRDTVGRAEVQTGAPRFFGIDYRGVLLYMRGDLTRPTPFQFLPAKGFSPQSCMLTRYIRFNSLQPHRSYFAYILDS